MARINLEFSYKKIANIPWRRFAIKELYLGKCPKWLGPINDYTYIVHPKKPETPAYLRGKLEHCGGGVGYVFA